MTAETMTVEIAQASAAGLKAIGAGIAVGLTGLGAGIGEMSIGAAAVGASSAMVSLTSSGSAATARELARAGFTLFS